ncbi:unnamed protein product [Allacma fusca]|uniref:Uncharacterized protein n=1 Tax=Allacma fusca TaxID=39272 RepID=A0A8J2L6T1_9HEXA|nr:unnamed protein product [Allacma fusca]
MNSASPSSNQGMFPRSAASQPSVNMGGSAGGFRSDTSVNQSQMPMGGQSGMGGPGGMGGSSGGPPFQNSMGPNNMMGGNNQMRGGPMGGMNGMPPQPVDPMCAQNPLYNCIAQLVNNIVQSRKGDNSNGNGGCCNQPACPVPFIIRKVKPARKRCCAPAPCPQPCCGNIILDNPNSYMTKIRTVSRGCCRPRRACCPAPCFPPTQCCGSTNPFENRCCTAPILLVQGGRCQTIQIADVGARLASAPAEKRAPSVVAKKKKKSKKSSGASAASSSSGSSGGSSGGSGGGSDDDDDDDDDDD